MLSVPKVSEDVVDNPHPCPSQDDPWPHEDHIDHQSCPGRAGATRRPSSQPRCSMSGCSSSPSEPFTLGLERPTYLCVCQRMNLLEDHPDPREMLAPRDLAATRFAAKAPVVAGASPLVDVDDVLGVVVGAGADAPESSAISQTPIDCSLARRSPSRVASSIRTASVVDCTIAITDRPLRASLGASSAGRSRDAPVRGTCDP